MHSRLVRRAVAASACALLISASIGVSGAAFADVIPDPLISAPPIDLSAGDGSLVGVSVGSTEVTVTPPPVPTAPAQPDPASTTAPAGPTGTSQSPATTTGSAPGSGTTGTGAAPSTSSDAGTASSTSTAPTTTTAADPSAKRAGTAKASGPAASSGQSAPVLGPAVEGTTLFSDDSSPLGILAGGSPARTVMSNAVGIAMLGGLGAILLVVIGLRLAVLRRRSQA